MLNLDGPSVFKSRNISIWPVRVQVLHLSLLFRPVKNMAMLAVWHGQGKPDFRSFLIKFVHEMKTIVHQSIGFEKVGGIRLVARCVVCNMPDTAYSL